MNRREALAAVSALLGGTIVGSQSILAGCALPDTSQQGAFEGLLGAGEMRLLDEIGETILPTTADSPGAKAARIGEFTNVIVTDCYSPENQLVFQAGLQKIKSTVAEQYGRSFMELDPVDRHAFVLALEAENLEYDSTRGPDEPETHYYRMIKELTLWGYFTSEIGATQALMYIAIPGRYEGCIPYEDGGKAWAT